MVRSGFPSALITGVALLALRARSARRRRGTADGQVGVLHEDQNSDAGYRYGSLAVVVIVSVLLVVATALTIGLGPFGPVANLAREVPVAGAVRLIVAGDAAQGRAAILAYECRACHTVPGLPRLAEEGVGPPLTGLAGRVYIAGVLPNRPKNLVAWIQDPPAFAPSTAMPEMGIDKATATHIAAYLYSQGR